MVNFYEYVRWLAEVTVLAVIYFYVLRALRGTRGLMMLVTVATLLSGLWILSRVLELPALQWIIQQTSYYLPFFLIVIFQTEIRRLLTMVLAGWLRTKKRQTDHEQTRLLTPTVSRMSSAHVGGLIAIEQTVGLEAWAVSGVSLEAPLRQNQLLETIFHEGGPLHDGGVIIRKTEISCASCTFPLSERDDGNVNYGMRHKAALGLSEQSDAVVVVVSEETGRVSIVHEGKLERMANMEQFRRTLNETLIPLRRPEDEEAARKNWGAVRDAFRRFRAAYLLRFRTKNRGRT